MGFYLNKNTIYKKTKMNPAVDRKVQDSLSRIDNEAQKIQRSLEKSYMRSIQAKAMRMGADCFENDEYTTEQVQSCVSQTQQPITAVSNIVKNELEEFQKRLQRCLMTCQDNAKVAIQSKVSERAQVEMSFGNCMVSCSDKHYELMPMMKERIVDQIKQNIHQCFD